MSENNGRPEWLIELGAEVNRLAEEGQRTNARINAVLEYAKLQQGMLDDILKALEGQVQINQEVNQRLTRLEETEGRRRPQ